MKILFTLGFAALLSLTANAQIVVSAATLHNAGDTLRYDYDNTVAGIGISPAGPNQTWDFSMLTADFSSDDVVAAADLGSSFASFPNTEILNYIFQFLEGYADRTNSTVEIYGVAIPQIAALGIPADFVLSSPYPLQRAPLFYNNTYTANSGFDFTLATASIPFLDSIIGTLVPVGDVDSLRLTLGITRDEVLDAWGTAITPYGSYNVLRLNTLEYFNPIIEVYVSIFGFGTWVDITGLIPPGQLPIDIGPDTTQTIQLLDETSKEPIVFITPDDAGNITTIRYKRELIVGIRNTNPMDAQLLIFPNPTNEVLNVQLQETPAATYAVRILDVLGKTVSLATHSLGNGQTATLSVTQLPEGNYLLRIEDQKGAAMATRRFTVQHP